MKKYFLVSDIHSNYDALIVGLTNAGFDKANPNHIFLGVGDYFDRGEQTVKVLSFLLEMKALQRATLIRGNHDSMLLEYLVGISDGLFDVKYNGLGSTLEALSNTDITLVKHVEEARDKIKKNYPRLIDFLKNMVDQVSIGNYDITHAGYSENGEGLWEINNWTKVPDFVKAFPVENKTTYIFGHWGNYLLNKEFLEKDSNGIFMYKNFIGLDATTALGNTCNVLVIDETKDSITHSIGYSHKIKEQL